MMHCLLSVPFQGDSVDRSVERRVGVVADVRRHEQLHRVGELVLRLRLQRRPEDVPAAALRPPLSGQGGRT